MALQWFQCSHIDAASQHRCHKRFPISEPELHPELAEVPMCPEHSGIVGGRKFAQGADGVPLTCKISGEEYIKIMRETHDWVIANIPRTPEGILQIESIIVEKDMQLERLRIERTGAVTVRAQWLQDFTEAEMKELRGQKIGRKKSATTVESIEKKRLSKVEKAIDSMARALMLAPGMTWELAVEQAKKLTGLKT